jgi:hypothetical protein
LKYFKPLIVILLVLSVSALSVRADDEQILDIKSDYYGPLWDINHNGVTDYLDISSLSSHYGQSGSYNWIRDDINDNLMVDYLDVSMLSTHYGEIWIV